MRIGRSPCRAMAWGFALLAVGLAYPAGRLAAGDGGEVVAISRQDWTAARRAVGRLDVIMEKGGRVVIVASPSDRANLSARGIAWTPEPDPFLVGAARTLSADGGLNGAYHSPYEIETELRLLERDHPGRAKVYEIGESLEKRKILALRITDNPGVWEGEPAVLFMGCHHAREWISVEVPFLFGKHLLESYDRDPEVRDLVDRGDVWIVPIVNPDGLDYSIRVYRYWRKNRRANPDGTFGVDLNRNYGHRWGSDDIGSSGDPASEIYRGTAAFSEPETEAVRLLMRPVMGVAAVASYHSYSQVILYPWGCTTSPAPAAAEHDALAGALSGLMAEVNGTVYAYGQASTALYLTNGDAADWTYAVAGAPSFTIELPPVDIDGGGFFNDEAAIGSIFAENLPAMLHLTRYAVDHPLPTRRKTPLLDLFRRFFPRAPDKAPLRAPWGSFR